MMDVTDIKTDTNSATESQVNVLPQKKNKNIVLESAFLQQGVTFFQHFPIFVQSFLKEMTCKHIVQYETIWYHIKWSSFHYHLLFTF